MTSVRISMEKPRGHVYTNMDLMRGHILFDLMSEESITSIIVKLEGMAKTRLLPPHLPNERNRARPDVEVHKVLYQTKTVFPTPDMQRLPATGKSTGFTLQPGSHSFPFEFRIPINNSCVPPTGLTSKISLEGTNIDFARDARRPHVTTTLPPSLSGMPDDAAWIRYFVKVTVIRPRFYQINLRKLDFFIFLPIEPPRPPKSNSETYAKRTHEFSYMPFESKQKKKSIFSSFQKPDPTSSRQPIGPKAVFTIQTRLPSPPIITANEALPLRILVTKLEPFPSPIVIKSLQLRLFTWTHIKAHEQSKKLVFSQHIYSNLAMRQILGNEDIQTGVELECDSQAWASCVLPNTILPSFQACNIARGYQLEILIGLSLGIGGGIDTITLDMPVNIYSGIAPPQELLQRVHQPAPNNNLGPVQSPRPTRRPTDQKANPAISAPNSPTKSSFEAPRPRPLTPNVASSSSTAGQSQTPGYTVHNVPPEETSVYPHTDADFDAPPTYDEATTVDVPPVDGPRREGFTVNPDYYQGGADFDRHGR